MEFRTAGLHPEFPRHLWAVVEQPAGEPWRHVPALARASRPGSAGR